MDRLLQIEFSGYGSEPKTVGPVLAAQFGVKTLYVQWPGNSHLSPIASIDCNVWEHGLNRYEHVMVMPYER